MVKEEALKKTDLIDESKSNFRVARAAYTDHEIFEIEMQTFLRQIGSIFAMKVKFQK